MQNRAYYSTNKNFYLRPNECSSKIPYFHYLWPYFATADGFCKIRQDGKESTYIATSDSIQQYSSFSFTHFHLLVTVAAHFHIWIRVLNCQPQDYRMTSLPLLIVFLTKAFSCFVPECKLIQLLIIKKYFSEEYISVKQRKYLEQSLDIGPVEIPYETGLDHRQTNPL